MTLTQTVNSGSPQNPTQTETNHTVLVAVMNYSNKEIDGTLIQETDKKIYMSTEGLTVVPDVADTLTVEGAAHEIINVIPLSPAGTVVFYELQARR